MTAKDVAEYFLSRVDEDAGDSLSNLKIQKLAYYAQGYHLALHGTPLFNERIEAWQHGPRIYRSLSRVSPVRSKPTPNARKSRPRQVRYRDT